MTTIKKLQISGIRSYDPKSPTVINFSKPLTMFVGSNGSGKTTIIEALRFVCTGQNPPDSLKGKSFIHDPLFTGDCLVKAQIKLTLETSEKKPITIIRSFQLTQTKNSRKYQQIDATIRSINDEGEKITATHKCVEIDNIAAQIMKVSKAVLSNVIFCHQENSMWPLSDPKALKLKFDEIFASTRYTKALDRIKATRKNLKTKTDLLEKDLQLVKTNLQSYRKSKEELEKSQRQIEILETTSANLKDEISASKETLDGISETVQSLKGNRAELNALEFRLQTHQKEKRSIEKRLRQKFPQAEKELSALKNKSTRKMKLLQGEMENAQTQLSSLETSLKKLKEENEGNIEKFGKMQAEDDRNKRDRKTMEQMAQSIAQKHNLKTAELNSTEGEEIDCDKAEEVGRDVKLKLSNCRRELHKLTDGFTMNEQKMIKDVEKSQRKLTTDRQILKQSGEEQQANHRRISALNTQKSVLEKKRMAVAKAIEEIKAIEISLEGNAKELEDHKGKADSGGRRNKLKGLNERLSAVERELDGLRTQSTAKESVEAKERSLESVKKEFNRLLQTAKSRMVHGTPPTANLSKRKEISAEETQKTFNEFVAKRECNFKTQKSNFVEEIRNEKAKQGEYNGKLSLSKENIEDLKKEISEKRGNISENVELGKIGEMLKKYEEKLAKIRSKIVFESGAKFVYKKIIRKIEEDRKCTICDRKMFNKDVQKVIKSLKEKIETFENNNNSQKLTKAANEIKKRIESLQRISPAAKTIETMTEKVKIKERENIEYQNKLDECKKRLDRLDDEEKKLKEEEKELSDLLGEAKSLCALFDEVTKKELEIESEKYLMKAVDSGRECYETVKSERDAIKGEIAALEEELRESDSVLTSIMSQKHRLMVKLNETKGVESDIKQIMGDLDRNKRDLEEFSRRKTQSEELERKTRQKTQSESREVGRLQEVLKNAKAEFNIKKKTLSENIESLQREKTALEEIISIVRRYDSLQPERDEIFALLKEQKERKNRLEKEVAETARKTKGFAEDLQSLITLAEDLEFSIEIRQIEDAVRKDLERKGELQREISDLSGGRNIEELRETSREAHEGLTKLLFEAEGRRGAFKDQAEELSRKITQNNSFEEVEERFRDTFVNLETSLVALRDLEVYHKALDQALIQFHSMKMGEINQILRKYWKLVYKGGDIDFIEIVSDCKDSAVTVKSTRNYNYCVVMKCGEVRLEMRGRCSAGQKVLASLLIRLALAESFCGDCNVLALDEPTTNLDQENVQSFGRSLRELIRAKSEAQDFQLILITHNDKFAEFLGGKTLADEYYRVYKDERNCSKVKRVKI